ncbi:epithelial chloride channel protein-like protein [Dinothrombium tinctorium]|uniref:Epithelial chloride channel protein-like protein n=1 Tax=Dinothrombium tinctorium TaxID=1965070 RepID=A0A3S3PHG7_9ACAR|nr:epithelial chloride channel protein-like protein [Dinothrombium tinctorium]
MRSILAVSLFIAVTLARANKKFGESAKLRVVGITYTVYNSHIAYSKFKFDAVNFKDFDKVSLVIPDHFGFKFYEESVRKAFFTKQPNSLLVFVNWDTAISGLNYNQICSYFVPELVKNVIEKLNSVKKAGKSVEIIGHGIGAHVAGQIGRQVKDIIKVERIIGLDPSFRWFIEKPNDSLHCDDADNVTVIHSNGGRYGLNKSICSNDLRPNGGHEQPECKSRPLDKLCSHNAAWLRFIDLILGKSLDKYKSCNTFVLCLDFSGSMFDDTGKYRKMTNAAREFLATFNDISVGIVSFGSQAVQTHPIVEINSNRESLISSIVENNLGGTSIGGGLRKSVNLLNAALQGTKCSANIILATDGEQNEGETPADVLPDLLKLQIKVTTLAIGSDASADLENIADSTGGRVFKVNDDEAASSAVGDMHKNLESAVNKELDVEVTPIDVSSKNVVLEGNSVLKEKVVIDEGIGENTTFEVTTEDKKKIEIELMSPKNKTYTEKSPEYDLNTTPDKHKFKFKVMDPGVWEVLLKKKTKSKRSLDSSERVTATILVKSFPKAKSNKTIRLEGDLSSRVLTYPEPLRISAELGVGSFPVINAAVEAIIESGDKRSTISLNDNGFNPDEVANDGIYSGSIWELPALGRNSITIKAFSNGSAMLLLKENSIFKEQNSCDVNKCETLYPFEREVNMGSVKVDPAAQQINDVHIDRVTDVKVLRAIEDRREVNLQWTIPGNSGHNESVELFDVRIITNTSGFENGYKVTDDDLVFGTIKCVNCSEGELKSISVKVPEFVWQNANENGEFKMVFALKSILKTFESEISNLALITSDDLSKSSSKANVSASLVFVLTVTSFSTAFYL